MEIIKSFSLYFQAIVYVILGINHFVNPNFYLVIMPKWLPLHNFLHLSSGVFEIIFGLALLYPPTRNYGAYGLVILLALFFLVHADHLVNPPKIAYPLIIFRFLLQFVLIAWAWSLVKAG